jgi:hypothetical protein
MKKRFKDTKVGKFLIGEKGLFKNIGDTLPDNGFLGVVKNLISKDNTLSPFEKEKALELLKMDELDISFNIDDAWVELLKTLLVTVYVAYFGSRGFEKYQKIRK